MKIINTTRGDERVPYLIAINIVSMGTLATVIALVFNWGGVCIDELGVASPAAIWGEWCACGPLLVFITVTLVDKPDLSRVDWFLMVTFFLCLVTGFFIIIPQSNSMAIFWLVVSCLTYVPMLYLPFYVRRYDEYFNFSVEDPTGVENMSKRFAQRYNLSLWLTIILPFYTVNYLLAMYRVINAAQTIVIYQILSVLTKALFAAVTMDIHVEAFRQVQRVAREERRVVAARKAFLSYIFNEVHTPLNALTMGTEVLIRSNIPDSSARESLQMMKGASELMCETLHDVLDMQKLEEGKLQLQLCPFSLSDAVSKVLLSFKGDAKEKQIRFVKNVSNAVPSRVVGDRYRVEHVLSSLVSNAVKFSPEGKTVCVDVTAAPLSSGDGNSCLNVTVTVRDEGPGIPHRMHKQVFDSDPLRRPEQLLQNQGSGIGLPLCKRIVNMHGGSIGIVSSEGEGCSVHFTIPFEIYQPRRSRVAPSSFLEPIQESQVSILPLLEDRGESGYLQTDERECLLTDSFPTYQVLIVDDVLSNRKLLQMLLMKSDIIADVADNGLEALEMVRAEVDKYHVIFMDDSMPHMSGVEATRRLRELGFKHLIVGITSFVLKEDVTAFQCAGADVILGKPLKLNALNLIIQHIKTQGFLSQPHKLLVEHSNRLEWVSDF